MCFALTALIAAAQTGNVQGIIRTADGQPAAFVNVGIKETGKATAADENGAYQLHHVPAGKYTLVTSFAGLESIQQQVEVVAGQTTIVPQITLSENAQNLSEITISEQGKNKPESSEYVSKMPLKNIENPQVYNTVDTKLMKEQIVTNFSDALKNAPGVEKLWESTGRGGDGAGYYSMRGFSVQPNMVNGLPGLTNGSLDPVNIERIEVLKGPSGTLFGSSLVSYGGLINTVTKKPYQKFGGEVSYITGSFGLSRMTVDINTPISKEKGIYLRVNAAYHTENSFQDAGFRKSIAIAPTLLYQVNKKLSFLLVTEFLQTEGTNPTMLFLDRSAQVTRPNMDAFGYDSKRSYTSNNLSLKNPTSNLQAQMNYKLSDKWTSQTVVSRGEARSRGFYSYLYESSQFYPIDGVVMSRLVSNQNASTTTTDLQQNFIGNFKLGEKFNNKIVAGIDYYQNQTQNNNTDYVGNGTIYIGDAAPQMVYDSVFGGVVQTDYDSGILSEAGMNGLLEDAHVNNNSTLQQTYSAYFSDVISFESIGLSAMVSLRLDHFVTDGDITTRDDDFQQTALSPKFGLVYQPIKGRLSVFGNYMNGFSNVAPAQVANADGTNVHTKTFEPEHANQMEFGIKTNLIKNRLTSSVSYYNILVKNRVMQDPTNINNSTQGGEVESSGIEIDLSSSPVDGLDITLGYSYNESKVLKATAGTSYAVEGRRPDDAGPKSMLNAWATYRFTKGKLKGFGLGFGANAASERYIQNSAVTGTFALPAYTVLNASVFYNTANYRITCKLDNLANEVYYKGWSTINPQRPRSISASFTFIF